VLVTAVFGLAAASDVVQQVLVRTLNRTAATVPL
jgi:tRNA A37 threonylcarbamoyladenosine dehydratase